MVTLKPKDVHIALKRDDCISYLLQRFNFQHKEELFEAIQRVAPSGADDLIRKLEKKQRRSDRRDKGSNGAELDDQEETGVEEQPVQGEEGETNVAEVEEDTEKSIEQEKQDMSKLPDLEQLKAQEQELSTMLCNYEGQHKELVSKRRELVGRLANSQDALKELQRILKMQEDNVTQIYEEYQKCASDMDSINQKRKSCKDFLDDIRGQIAELCKATILVYQNCIEVENAEVPSISDEEINSEFVQLIWMTEAGELTITELKNFATLLKIVKVYQEEGRTFELVFDNSKLQSFWEFVSTQP